MPKRSTLEPHLSPDELQSRYRQASDPVERSHYQIIWLLASGKSPREVSAVTGYSRQWIKVCMRMARLELAWRKPHAPQTCVSTNSTTSAFGQ